MRRTALFVLCSLLLAAGCSAGGGKSSSAPSGAASGGLPTVTGAFGDKPSLTFPGGQPGKALDKKILEQGHGSPVAKGDLLVADYLGEVWKGTTPFDNSYDRKAPAAFPIGIGQVIKGWDEGLVGVRSGSRVLLVIPPDKGYGAQGNQQAGIKGTDTLVFVVDVVRSYGKQALRGDLRARAQAAPQRSPKVSGTLGTQPTITVPKGLTPPVKQTTTVLARGTGAPVKAGLLLVHFNAVSWANKQVQSTWPSGFPQGVQVAAAGQPGPFDPLVGTPVGSRVLLTLPPQNASATPKPNPAVDSLAVVIDIIAQPGTAKEAAR